MSIEKTEWKRSKTTRRYLTPPMSERLYTFWREGKVAFGEMKYEEILEWVNRYKVKF